MLNDDYIDLVQGHPYTVKRMYSLEDGHVMLEGSPRRYMANSFKFTDDKGKTISYSEAYRLYRLGVVKKKMGIE